MPKREFSITGNGFNIKGATGSPDEGGYIESDLMGEKPDDRLDELAHAAYNGLLSLILAQACSGMDVMSDTYNKAVQVALDALTNEYS